MAATEHRVNHKQLRIRYDGIDRYLIPVSEDVHMKRARAKLGWSVVSVMWDFAINIVDIIVKNQFTFEYKR